MSNFIIFSANYLPHLGGVERYTYNMARKMADIGHKITIITSDVSCDIKYEKDGNIEVYRLPSYKVLGERFPVLKINKNLLLILEDIFNKNFDFGIINTRFYLLSAFAAYILKKKNIPSILIEHGTYHFTVNNVLLDFFGHIYEHLITKFIKRHVSRYAGVSLACNQWLKHFKIKTSIVFYNAIDLKNIEIIKNSSHISLKKELSIPEDGIIITYSGRLVKEKGIEKLIAAVNSLNNKNIYLVIAGDGDLLNQIQERNYKNVFTLGKINFPNVIRLLSDTDIFCLPTDYPEGLPTSVLEAAACKCYIITTNAGGSAEVILDSSYGCILANNTPSEIANAISEAIQDRTLCNACAEKAYDRVINEFEWSTVTQKILSYIKRETN